MSTHSSPPVPSSKRVKYAEAAAAAPIDVRATESLDTSPLLGNRRVVASEESAGVAQGERGQVVSAVASNPSAANPATCSESIMQVRIRIVTYVVQEVLFLSQKAPSTS